MAPRNTPETLTPDSLKIENYYDICWSKRFRDGHNPVSLAIHLGYYENGETDSEAAKLALNKLVAEKLALTAGTKRQLIDAGCGVGGTCIFLARHYAGLHVKAINLSEAQLQLARQNAQFAGVTEAVEFVTADYCESGLPDASADGIYAIESLCHAEVKERFFDEAFRLLRPGGILVIADYVETDQISAGGINNDYEDFCRGWEVGRYLAEPVTGLRKTGFVSATAENITAKVYPGIVRSHGNAVRLTERPDYSDLHHTMQNHLRACIALKRLVDRKEISYSIITAVKPDTRPE